MLVIFVHVHGGWSQIFTIHVKGHPQDLCASISVLIRAYTFFFSI